MPIFSKRLLSFADTKYFSRIITDYLSGELTGKFSSYDFSQKAFGDAILQRGKLPVNRQLLHDLIHEQYQKLTQQISSSGIVNSNISLLQRPTTYTVTTGHQLNLFTGPVYFIYKLVTTINLAARLKALYPEYDFVPVYWMASEDHDLEEINHIHLFGKKIEWTPANAGAAGKISCSGIQAVISRLNELLTGNSKAEKIIGLFSKAYDEKRNLSEATRILVHELFGDKGLVIVDGDDARLKKIFIPEMKDDVENHSAFSLVNETVNELEKNYRSQVHPREINLFYLGDGFRKRIIEKDGRYEVLEADVFFSKEELLREIDLHPEKFSPNVVLRPLYQEKILPNIAYVGGPAEIAYWLEYKKMFEHYSLNLPVLVLRNCLTIIDEVTGDKMKKFGFEPEDIFMHEEELIKKHLKNKQEDGFSIESLLKQSDAIFNDTLSRVNEIDPTLQPSVEAEKQKIQNSLRALEEKIRRAEKKKHEITVNQVKKIKEKLFPGNQLQERHENILAFYSKYGDDFLTTLFKQLDPFEAKFMLLIEEAST